jgi:ectoine hydroxylase-related dioxygenase (phytanoyl-CoA dioxygenase family)
MSLALADCDSPRSEEHTRDAATLLEQGFIVLKAAAPKPTVSALAGELDDRFAATPLCEGDFYGRRTKRFGKLLARSRAAGALVLNQRVLALAETVLQPFCDVIILNLTQAVELQPGQRAQPVHRDQDMWRAEKGRIEYLVNVMWPLTPFTEDNGGTIIYPHSHGQNALGHGAAGEAVTPALSPGDALVFLGSTLHGGGANLTSSPRRGVIVSYCLGWLMPFENPWLAYPPEIARRWPRELSALVGYRQHRPNLCNVDGQCPSLLLSAAPPPDYLPAKDALLPEQAAALRRLHGGEF